MPLPDDVSPFASRVPRAVIFGCAGAVLSDAERRFFAEADPLGFILFARNCPAPDEIRHLTAALRECVGRNDAPILIDQEGGRVARLRPPYWRSYPAAAALAALPDPQAGEAVRLAARLIGDDLAGLGIDVDCAPVLDLPAAGADPVIGDRAYGRDPRRVAQLGRACCEGLLAGGVLPVVKHIPGHGRARIDSHRACPRVDASHAELSSADYAPFRELAAMPWAMTAHIVFAAIDDGAPATLSRRVIDEIIRREIGFDGVLLSDDISMGALDGSLAERSRAALAAGCDVVLHCTGDLAEMDEIAGAIGPLSHVAGVRLARGEALRRRSRQPFDRHAAEVRFDELAAEAAQVETRP